MPDWAALKAELTDDPLTRGYAGMTDAQVLASLLTQNRSVARQTVRGAEIYNAIVPGEFQALSAAQQQFVRDVFSLGDEIDARPSTNARNVLATIFDNTTTLTNLAALLSQTISRAEELGLGELREHDIARVRRV